MAGTPFLKYLLLEKGIKEEQVAAVVQKIKKYDDIYDEFCYWLENRNYEKENPVEIEGYTAKRIFELNPDLDGIGVYNFLVTLRDDPKRAIHYIEMDFPED